MLDWNGREIHAINDGDVGTKVRVTVSKYLKSRKPTHITYKSLHANDPLDAPHRSEMKGIVGDLQYVASTCRPDLAGGTSLVQTSELSM